MSRRTCSARGVGRALLDALIEACTARGYRQMIAVIGDSPISRLDRRCTERCGFVDVGTLADVGFKFGRWLDTLLMQRALGEGAQHSAVEPRCRDRGPASGHDLH